VIRSGIMARPSRQALLGVALGFALLATARPQTIDLGLSSQPVKHQHLELITDSVQLTAGRPEVVELIFRVAPGFHINSHDPKDETLIPTNLKLDALPAVKAAEFSYPQGASFRLGGSDGETLSVYQGEFRVAMRMTAQRGQWTLTGNLHYQACDNAACFPPRNLPVRIAVNAQ
jgi:hypothetical protein